MNRNNTFRWLAIVNLILAIFPLCAAELPERPVPPRLVNDLAGILDPEKAAMLEARLVAFNDSTSTQIAIVTVPSLGDYDITDFADRLAEKWGVDGPALVEKLRGLNEMQALAIIDAAERFWQDDTLRNADIREGVKAIFKISSDSTLAMSGWSWKAGGKL